ncbi:hypothetical protein E2C01_026701 [Portunus trituberculatus]|uniref:Uncharacterized protein n=1 Tax=Portunus trituberculatus TaxID=210409 RepID=A0A5B7ELP8_PORTR|nr:hypothetical protein [Portunus trituberculatus]
MGSNLLWCRTLWLLGEGGSCGMGGGEALWQTAGDVAGLKGGEVQGVEGLLVVKGGGSAPMPTDLTPMGEEVSEPGHQAEVKLQADGFGDDGGVVDKVESFPEVYKSKGA